MNNKCPYCHKDIEIQVYKPEEYYQPCPDEADAYLGTDLKKVTEALTNNFLAKNTEHNSITVPIMNSERNLADYLKNLKETSNKIGYLVYAFKRLHDYYINDEQDESVNAFSFMGKIWKNANKDYGYLMKVIWDTSSVSIAGSHLTYINKTVIERKKRENQVSITRVVNKQPSYK